MNVPKLAVEQVLAWRMRRHRRLDADTPAAARARVTAYLSGSPDA